MKWLIGLDLRPSGRGALGFARWLHDHAKEGAAPRFAGVHVLEEATLLQRLRYEHLDSLEQKATSFAKDELTTAGIENVIEGPRIDFGVHADEVLAAEAAREADGVIVGRRAATQDVSFVRLGRVARRLLRSLPTPTIVVPPDYAPKTAGRGPIVLATDLQDDSIGAGVFAGVMARSLDRPLVVVHVIPQPDFAPFAIPSATAQQLYGQLGLRRDQNIDSWMARAGLTGTDKVLATGDVVTRVLSIADHEGAPLIVCGSRKLSATNRLVSSSVGSALAAHANTPVAVVPPSFIPRSVSRDAVADGRS